jgi:SAM-dependent methyltransferase
VTSSTAPDALRRLVALGRLPSDRELLGPALGELDRRHGLGSKISAEPNLEAIMTEFASRLMDAFGALSAIRGQAVLDIACGSNSSRSPVTGLRTAEFEPWMCRLLRDLGARPVGVDIGDLADEAFVHHRVDLGVPGALDFLASGSFDAIHESRLFGSPEFRAAHGRASERIRREIHRQERRLLRPGGILIHSDGRPGPRGPEQAGRVSGQ